MRLVVRELRARAALDDGQLRRAGGLAVDAIAEATGLAQARVERALAELRVAGLVAPSATGSVIGPPPRALELQEKHGPEMLALMLSTALEIFHDLADGNATLPPETWDKIDWLFKQARSREEMQ